MRKGAKPARPGLNRAWQTALALCTFWLVIQNCLLLAFVPWTRLPEATRMATVALKTAVLVLGPLWILGSAAILGWAFVTWLARDRGAGDTDWEIDHGNAR
ncbi:MAG: hypothetical protein IT347_08385 [Candidatus Eisenbacteria bacterium]|nr:hypothetical protein [Candidatus Eisenbacteria bacterium]